MKNLYASLLAISLTLTALGQPCGAPFNQWPINTNDNTSLIKKVITDHNTGDIYLLVTYTDQVTLGCISLTANAPSNPAPGQEGAFVCRIDPAGNQYLLAYTQSTAPTGFDAFDLDLGPQGQKLYLFFKVANVNALHFRHGGGSSGIATTQTQVGTMKIDIAAQTVTNAFLPFLPSGLPIFSDELNCGKYYDNGSNGVLFFGGKFSGLATVKKWPFGAPFATTVISDNYSGNTIIDVEIIDNNNLYAAANLTTPADFGLGTINPGPQGNSVVMKASYFPVPSLQSQIPAYADYAKTNDIELDGGNMLHIVGEFHGYLGNWNGTQSPPLSSNVTTAFYVKFDTIFSQALTAYQVSSSGQLVYASASAIDIFSDIVHITGSAKADQIEIHAANNTFATTNLSGTSKYSMWAARFNYVSSPANVVWLTGSLSPEDVKGYDIGYFHGSATNTFNAYVAGSYLDNTDFPPLNLSHPMPGVSLGFLARINSATAGQFYKTTGIGENAAREVSFYPNPSNGIFYIHTTGQSPFDLTVFDLAGKMVLQKTQIPPADGRIIDLSTLPPGFYTARISSNGNYNYHKLIVQ